MAVKEARRGGYYVSEHGDLNRLHSAYDPEREARKIISDEPSSCKTLVIAGAGLGYVLKLIAASATATPEQVVVFEPYPELLRRGNELGIWSSQDFSNLAVLGPETEDPVGQLGELLPLESAGDYRLLEWPDYRRKKPEFFRHFLKALRELQNFQQASLKTLEESGELWLTNFRKNIRNVPRPRVPALEDYRGNVALVAAGPGLDDQLEWLSENRDSLYLISVNTAGPVLKKNGIVPDLIVAVDARKIVREDLAHSAPEQLLLSPYVPPEITSSYNYRASLIGLESPLSSWLKSAPYLPAAEPGGSVTTTTIDLLTRTPAAKIYLLGADMKGRPDQYYARGTWRREKLLNQANRFQPYEQVFLEWRRDKQSGPEEKNQFGDEREWFNRLGRKNQKISMPPRAPDWWTGEVAPERLKDTGTQKPGVIQPSPQQAGHWFRQQLNQLTKALDSKNNSSPWEKFIHWIEHISDNPELEISRWESLLKKLTEKYREE